MRKKKVFDFFFEKIISKIFYLKCLFNFCNFGLNFFPQFFVNNSQNFDEKMFFGMNIHMWENDIFVNNVKHSEKRHCVYIGGILPGLNMVSPSIISDVISSFLNISNRRKRIFEKHLHLIFFNYLKS